MAEIIEADDRHISGAVKAVSTFDEMGLKEDLIRGIHAQGFENLSATQRRAILQITSGRDVIAQAQSGVRKTAVFSIAILNTIDTSFREIQALILSPVRELATEIQSVVMALGDYTNAQCYACIGGTRIKDDIQALVHGVHVVSGTLGRVSDMIRRGKLRTTNIKMLVLNEADEILSEGFGEQLQYIHQSLPSVTQVVILSATLPRDVLEMTTKFTKDPIRIVVQGDELTLEGIKQFFVAVEREERKLDVIMDLFHEYTLTQVIIFCNARRKVDFLTEKMRAAGHTVSSLHRKIPQNDQDAMIAEFQDGSSSILITTDAWARVVDVENVSLVINYDLPRNNEDYIHRIGRSDSFVRTYVAINILTFRHMQILRDIEQHYGTQIDGMPVNVAELV
ncbi:RNA helicase [Tulasnella sp. 331]|nr:RNA helicase [Tulasnella sp. 331]KAG8873351.1 RNA helicase [Tulasnella sp. 332]